MTKEQKERYEKARMLREKNEYHLPDFRPDTPYAESYQGYQKSLTAAGGDPDATRSFAAGILDEYYANKRV